MRFDKGSLSNLINAVLTSRCHSRKSSVHLNNAKNTIIVNNMIFMHRVMKIPTVKWVGGGLDRKPEKPSNCVYTINTRHNSPY